MEEDEAHPNLKRYAKQFLSSTQLEGYSKSTIENYGIHLRIFSEHVKKKVENITTNDVRDYLSRFSHQKSSTVATKLAVIKSFLHGSQMRK